ncbi:MAG: hypothetical protein JW795_03900 [Chitinivibrionales bacterium]|nr:hypothetical protein [Chitinivibrionales bacterium]
MEFEVIILATMTVVLLFQIIILINQHKNGKLIREFIAQRAKSFQSDRDRRDRKDNNFRQHRQNQQDFRSKQPQASSLSAPSGDGDNVEKSLRDINLKLKNAERDQEAARRRIQENFGKDHSRRRHHNENNRGGGGRDSGRDHRRDHRDRHNRNNWHDRNNQEKSFQTDHPSSDLESPAAATAAAEVTMEPKVVLPDLNPTDYDGDNTQHGRKFMVKRRLLKEDTAEESVASGQADIVVPGETDASQNGGEESAAIIETAPQTEQASDTEISFGRR